MDEVFEAEYDEEHEEEEDWYSDFVEEQEDEKEESPVIQPVTPHQSYQPTATGTTSPQLPVYLSGRCETFQ